MSLLTDALQEIDIWIQTSASSHASQIRRDGIRSGLDRDLIQVYSEEIDFHFSEEVYELYAWHDGVIQIGDYANPVFFNRLEQMGKYLVREQIPYSPYLPLFTGDKAYWVIPEASRNQKKSPIFLLDGYITPNSLKPEDGELSTNIYAPSITSLMQAIAECARTYDGISAQCMDGSNQDLYLSYKRSILSPIYDKYGVVGSSSGIWH
jgi:hypothetical protein